MSDAIKVNAVELSRAPQLPYSLEEAINRLRINISFFGNDVRRILIVSSEPNEGKSFVTFNLWSQMAQAGEKTLLLDADMRNSNLRKQYGIRRVDGAELKGTSHYLAGSADFDDVLMHTNYEDGDMIVNAENVINPSMLLESDRFNTLTSAMTKYYRYLFIDAPPLGFVSDAERIGSICDGAVLCIRSGVTPKSVVRESVRQLERAGCPILGIVLNRVDESKGGYGRYGRYGKYGYYGRYGYGYGRYGEYYGGNKDQ